MPLSDPSNALVEFHAVSYTAPNGTAPILSELNLKVKKERPWSCWVSQGAVRTTTLKLINRLLLPTSGQVLVEGRATTEWDRFRLRPAALVM